MKQPEDIFSFYKKPAITKLVLYFVPLLFLSGCGNKFELIKKHYSLGFTLLKKDRPAELEMKKHFSQAEKLEVSVKGEVTLIVNSGINNEVLEENKNFRQKISHRLSSFRKNKVQVKKNFRQSFLKRPAQKIRNSFDKKIAEKKLRKNDSFLLLVLVCLCAALLLGFLTFLWILSGFSLIVTILLLPLILALALLLLILKGH